MIFLSRGPTNKRTPGWVLVQVSRIDVGVKFRHFVFFQFLVASDAAIIATHEHDTSAAAYIIGQVTIWMQAISALITRF